MSRFVLVGVALFVLAPLAKADRIAPIGSATERALRSPVVVVGKVTAIEKDMVEAEPYPKAGSKVPYKIAVVKVETGLAGADNITHIKVGFVPSRRYEIGLAEGQEVLLFLVKHHDGTFHTMHYMTPPIDSKNTNFKADVEAVKKILATVADPTKALKAEKADERFAAAVAIIYKLRSAPDGTPKGVETVALTADESRPILKALGEGKWVAVRPGNEGLNGYSAFAMLGLTDADGWKQPKLEAGKDFAEQMRDAYTKWLDGPGKDYKIKKLVPKKAEK